MRKKVKWLIALRHTHTHTYAHARLLSVTVCFFFSTFSVIVWVLCLRTIYTMYTITLLHIWLEFVFLLLYASAFTFFFVLCGYIIFILFVVLLDCVFRERLINMWCLYVLCVLFHHYAVISNDFWNDFVALACVIMRKLLLLILFTFDSRETWKNTLTSKIHFISIIIFTVNDGHIRAVIVQQRK